MWHNKGFSVTQLQATYIQWISHNISDNYLLALIPHTSDLDFLVNPQIIKASTTAQEGTMTSFLRGLPHRRRRPL